MDDTVGTIALDVARMPAAPAMTPEEELARNDKLRAEVRRVRDARGCALADLAREAGIPGSTFSAWVAGTYKGAVRTYDDKVEVWLRSIDGARRAATLLRETPGFVATAAAQQFFAALEHAQHAPDLVLVTGAAGVGKTTAVAAYQVSRPNVWVVTAEPCITTPRAMLDEIAEQLGVSETRSTHRISRATVHRVRGTRGLLIVDEAQHLTTPTLDQIRTLHDLSGIGVALVGNERVSSRIDGGARKPEFAQLFSRVGMRVQRPRPLRADIDALLDAWAIVGDEERRLLAAIAREAGALRLMTKVIRVADMLARSEEASLGARQIGMAYEQLAARKLGGAAEAA